MKKLLWKRILPAILTLVMLVSLCLPTAAMSVSAPNEEEPLYTVVTDGGILRIQVNAERVYEMLKDRDLTREELSQFIPDEVLELLQADGPVTEKELLSLAAEYITADDLLSLKNVLPAEILMEYFDPSVLDGFLTLGEILEIIALEELLSDVTSEELSTVITPEIVDMILENETARSIVLTTEFVEEILFADDNAVLKDVLADEELVAKLSDLVDGDVVKALLEDPEILRSLVLLMETEEKVDLVLQHPEILDRLSAYLVAHKEDVVGFMEQENVKKALKSYPDIFLHEDILRLLIDENILNRENFREMFKGSASAEAIISDLMNTNAAKTLLSSESFVNNVFADNALLDKVATDELIDKLIAQGLITAEQVLSDEMTADPIPEATADRFLEVYNITDEDVLAFHNGTLTVNALIAKYTIGARSLLDNGFADRDRAVARIKALLLSDDEATVDLFAESVKGASVSLDDYWKHIDDATFRQLTAVFSDDSLLQLFEENPEIFEELIAGLDDATVDRMYKKVTEMDTDTLVGLVKAHIHEMVDVVGLEAFFEYDKFDTMDLINAVGGEDGYFYLLKKNILTVEEIATAIGKGDETAGYRTILDLLGAERVINEIGLEWFLPYVDLDRVVEAAGGYTAVALWFSFEEIIDILDAIGTKNLADFARDTGITEKADFSAMAKDMLAHIEVHPAEWEAFLSTCKDRFVQLVTNEIDTMELNGTEIYRYGEFDLQTIVTVIAREIPDVDKILSMQSGDVLAALILSTEMRDVTYSYGISVELVGDLKPLQDALVAYADYFRLDVTEDLDVTLNAILPSAVGAELYERALLTERLPAELRETLLELPTMTVSELSAWLKTLDGETLVIYAEEIAAKAESIRDKAYGKLEAVLGDTPGALSTAMEKVDSIIDALSDPQRIVTVRDKGVALLDKVAAKAGDRTVADYYVSNGTFSASASFSVDLYRQLSRFVELPEDLLVIFGNDMTVAGSLDATVTLNGLYRVDVTDAKGVTSTYFLPEGISLSVLKLDRELSYTFEEGAKMPASDVTFVHENLYQIRFLDEAGNLIETVPYTDDMTVADLKIPEAPAKTGYTAAWEEFESKLWNENELTVDVKPVYTAITYTATFKAEGAADQKVTFTVETVGSFKAPAVPAREGYTGVWESYVLEAKDITVKAVYTANTYTATFKATGAADQKVTFTVETIGSFVAPAVPARAGYTGVWKEFRLGASDITVEAEYTPITYTATFKATGAADQKVTFTVETVGSFKAPAVPARAGYTGAWESYTLGAKDITVHAVYTPITYTATFKATGAADQKVTFTVETIGSFKAPAVPARAGYTGAWETYVLGAKDITVHAVYTPITYTVTFMADGKQVGEPQTFTVENKNITPPAVPAKAGYTGKWETYTLGTANLTVQAIYTKNPVVQFVNGSELVLEQDYSPENPTVTAPALPAKEGYTGAWTVVKPDGTTVLWSEYNLAENTAATLTVKAVYTPITYTVTFMADGAEVEKVTFTLETVDSFKAPAVPAKKGYNVAWESYTLGASDLTVEAEYTLITYKATFKADGKVVAEIDFTVADESLQEPEVPAKAGYTGKWETYVLDANDITVNAVYTAIGGDTDTDTDTDTAVPPIGGDDDGTNLWWLIILLIIVLLIVIALVIWGINRKNGKNGTPPPAAAAAAVAASGPVATVKLSAINGAFAAGETVDLAALKAKGIVPEDAGSLKITASGRLSKPLNIVADSFSAQAIHNITEAGGKAIEKA